MKFLILGDLHIGKGINIGKSQSGKINSRIQDQIDLLEWSLNYCLQNKINTIVITGDVYQDPRPHPGVISIVMCWLIKCQSHSVSVHIIRGNHDVMRSGTYSVSALDLVSDVNLHAKAILRQDIIHGIHHLCEYLIRIFFPIKRHTRHIFRTNFVFLHMIIILETMLSVNSNLTNPNLHSKGASHQPSLV